MASLASYCNLVCFMSQGGIGEHAKRCVTELISLYHDNVPSAVLPCRYRRLWRLRSLDGALARPHRLQGRDSTGHARYLVLWLRPPGIDSASADLNKIIRFSYGNEIEYQRPATEAAVLWDEWNNQIDEAVAAGDAGLPEIL